MDVQDGKIQRKGGKACCPGSLSSSETTFPFQTLKRQPAGQEEQNHACGPHAFPICPRGPGLYTRAGAACKCQAVSPGETIPDCGECGPKHNHHVLKALSVRPLRQGESTGPLWAQTPVSYLLCFTVPGRTPDSGLDRFPNE